MLDEQQSQALCQHWHDTIDDPALPTRKRYKQWLTSKPDERPALSEAWGDAVEAALAAPPAAADLTPQQLLATVLMLDHYNRRIQGKIAAAYRGHEAAAALAQAAFANGAAEQLQPIEQLVLAMACSNTEDIATHDAGLAILEKLNEEAGDALTGEMLELAQKRREIIRHYGRLPVRNRPLGRASTPIEAYFVVGTSFFYE